MDFPDYTQLYYAVETSTPRKYLYRHGNEWMSLATKAEEFDSLDAFATFVGEHTPNLRNDWLIITYLWLLSRSENLPAYLAEVQKFLSEHEMIIPNSTDELIDKLNRWITDDYNTALKLDTERFQLLEDDNTLIMSSPMCYYTLPVLDRILVTLTVNEDTLGIDVLNRSIVSENIPLIVDVNQDGKTIVKAYDKDNIKNVNFNVNRIEQKGNLFLITKSGRVITYSYVDNHNVSFSIKSNENIENIIDLLRNTSMFQFGGITSKELVSSFNIFGSAEDDYSYPLQLYPMIMALLGNGLLNRYLYTDEVRKIFLDRSRFSLTYRRPFDNSFPKITIDFTPQQSVLEQEHIIYDVEGNSYSLANQGILYLNMTITTPDEEMRNMLIPYLTQLFSLWREYQKDTFAGIEYWTNETITSLYASKQTVTTGERRKIFLLRELAGDLIVPGYAKSCIGDFQPTLVPHDRVDEWRSETFEWKGEIHHREVVPIPRDDPKYFFGCDSKDAPFIGVKCNTKENKNIYPVIPCCYKENQNQPRKMLWRYFTEENANPCQTRGVQKGVNTIRTMKLLSAKREGYMPPLMTSFLHTIGLENPVRYGTVISPNSLLHSILTAIGDKGYYQLQNEEKMEEYVREYRREIAKKDRNLNAFRQELYDKSIPEIRAMLEDVDSYLDPKIYFHGLERYFHVRLFLFELDNDKSIFALPRGKWYTVYSQEINLPSVLIITHRGTTVDSAVKYPQSELIINANSDIMAYTEYTPRLNETLNSVQVNSLLRILPKHISHITGTRFDPVLFFKDVGGIVSQYIDGAGKGTGVILKTATKKFISVITPPFAPLRLPVSELKTSSLDDSKELLDKLPTPNWYFQNNNYQGFGYYLSNKTQRLYILLDQLPANLEIPKGVPPITPIASEDESEMELLHKTKRGVLFLLQTMLYLYSIYSIDNNLAFNAESVARFWDEYVTIADGTYNWTHLQRRFPQGNNIQECIQEYVNTVPGLILNDKVRVTAAVSPKLQSTIIKWFADRRNEVFALPEYYDNYFTNENDFEYQPNQRIFLNWDNYKSWVNYNYNSHNFVRTFLDQEDNTLEEPYVYYNADTKRYWIIQNVTGGNWKRAIKVAVAWRELKINIGFLPDEYTQELPKVNIYKISESNQLELTTPEDPEGINIYEYTAGNFSALLPLFNE
jgi:hypothetical protein